MQQSTVFFQVLFYAIIFCVLAMLGLYLYFVRKPVASGRTLQKALGSIFVILAINMLMFGYMQNTGSQSAFAFESMGTALLDIIAAVVFIYKVYRAELEVKSEECRAELEVKSEELRVKSEEAESNLAESGKLKVSSEREQSRVESSEARSEERRVKSEECQAELEAESGELKEEEEEEKEFVETDNVNALNEADEEAPLEAPNMDDMIFFQRVESLMATKRLFCEQEISRESVASAVGTNRTYLTRSIKGATGKTFLEYLTGLRTSYAATLLTTTDEPLDIIGTMAGFRSKSAYYRAFSAAYGCTPSEYRKR